MNLLVASVIGWTVLAQTALACVPKPGDLIEEPPMREWVIASGKVTSILPLPTNDGDACVGINYELISSLVGDPGPHFTVKVCETAEDLSAENLSAKEGVQALLNDFSKQTDYGFSVGATALVGLIRLPAKERLFRFAVPDCWGPFSASLDDLTPEEQKDLRDALLGRVQSGE